MKPSLCLMLRLPLLALLLLALPRRGIELRLCLADSGEVALLAESDHACRGGQSAPTGACHDTTQVAHGACVDLVLCLAEAKPSTLPRLTLPVPPVEAVPAVPEAMSWSARRQVGECWRRAAPVRVTPWLDCQRTVVLRV